MNRQDRDREAEMRLTERTRKLIPDKVRRTKRSDQLYVARMMLVVTCYATPVGTIYEPVSNLVACVADSSAALT